MNARVTQLRVRRGKSQEFLDALKSTLPLLRKQAGFRALIALRTAPDPTMEVMVISVWDSLDDLKGSEKNLFLTQVLSRLIPHCEGFPTIREHEVLVGEFAAD